MSFLLVELVILGTSVLVRCCYPISAVDCICYIREKNTMDSPGVDKAPAESSNSVNCKHQDFYASGVSIMLLAQISLISAIFLSYFYYPHSLSVFGEDALVNVSVEKKDDNDGKLAGYIRIRSKTQGIALSLGDRITSVQRGVLEIKAQ